MGAVKPLSKEINHYLDHLSTEQMKVVLSVVKSFAREQESDLWEDKEFIAELDRRTAEYESGNAKILTLNQLEDNARAAYKAKSKSK